MGWVVKIEDMEAVHDSGIVFKFTRLADGTMGAKPSRIPDGVHMSDDELANLSREAGEEFYKSLG
jgi:hypothetical protein